MEDWWVRLDDSRKVSVSFAARFMQAVARTSGRGFDAIFGERLLSAQALASSASCSLASISIFAMIYTVFGLQHQVPLGTLLNEFYFWLYLVLPLFPILLNDLELKVRSVRISFRYIWYLLLLELILNPLVAVLFLLTKKWGATPATHTAEGVLALLLFSFFCDTTCIAVLRAVFRLIETSRKLSRIAYLLVANIFISMAFFVLPMGLGLYIFNLSPSVGFLGLFVMLGFALNTIDILVCLTFFAIALLMIGHHMLWSVASRFLYVLQRCGIVNRRRQFGVVGIFLLFYSFGVGSLLWKLLKLL